MRVVLLGCLALGLALSLPAVTRSDAPSKAAEAKIIHEVYFTLKDNSGDARQKLVAACKKYLTKHPGSVSFAVGTRAQEFDRPINDQQFDVSIIIIFTNKAAYAKYENSARHQKFIQENKDTWKKVRVFDSELAE